MPNQLLQKLEIAKRIIQRDGRCTSVSCDECPLVSPEGLCPPTIIPEWKEISERQLDEEKVKLCKEFVDKHQIWIVCAANKLNSGLIVCGARHHDQIMNDQILLAKDTHIGEKQGFIDQRGKWWSREDALIIAKSNGQIRRSVPGDDRELFSENLY